MCVELKLVERMDSVVGARCKRERLKLLTEGKYIHGAGLWMSRFERQRDRRVERTYLGGHLELDFGTNGERMQGGKRWMMGECVL